MIAIDTIKDPEFDTEHYFRIDNIVSPKQDKSHYYSFKGGNGSGNFGHAGRVGEVGGSGSGSGNGIKPATSDNDIPRFLSDVKSSDAYKNVAQKLETLQNETKSGDVTRWSIEKNTDEQGNYTAERQALHQEIINDTLTKDTIALPGERPKAVLLIGPPGAGKTTTGQPAAQELVGNSKLAVINADDAKSRLGAENWNVAAYHEESSYIADSKMLQQGIEGNHNLMYDGTGNNTGKIVNMVDMFNKAGYDVSVVDISISRFESVNSVWGRFNRGGRFVDPSYAEKVDHNPDKTYNVLKSSSMIKSGIQIDNSNYANKITDRFKR
jgi:predicted ABC-type ATPase